MPINKLIAADQLHWCEEQGQYAVISKEEAQRISRKCEGLTEDETVAVIMWYQEHKTGALLWENFMKGKISVAGVSGDGQPCFAPVDL
jgi:hypothetical protein